MPAKQTLLFPDPRPLVERLGAEFFRRLPECPGVYLMHDARERVLYVGKAKSLRKRLNSYRVANPERLARRHLRLLHAVAAVAWEPCADEASALARESALIRELKPPFNRAGTWPGPPRFLGWRCAGEALQLGVFEKCEPSWAAHGPLHGAVRHVCAALARLLWLGLNPARTASELPAGWARGELPLQVTLTCPSRRGVEASNCLDRFFQGDPDSLAAWVGDRASAHPLDRAMITEDLDCLRRRFHQPDGSRKAAH